MACRAIAGGVEDHEPMLCLVGNGALVAGDPAVERGYSGNDGALEGGDRLSDVAVGDAFARKYRVEACLIAGDRLQAIEQNAHRHVHLCSRGDRAGGLSLERVSPAVPEESLAPGA